MMYQVYDLETQIHKYLHRKASPFYNDNYVVYAGWKRRGDKQCSWKHFKENGNNFMPIADDVTLLVGFNLKFDLLWQWENPDLIAFFKRGGKIWDCQYAEYLIHGQARSYHYPNLNETAPKYGGTEKIDAVKVLWDQGIQTSDIDYDLIIEYLVGSEEEGRNAGDVGNTEKIFLGQLKKAKDLGMVKAISSRMDGLLATTDMEWNGLKIDVDEAKRQYKELSEEREKLFDHLQSYVPKTPEHLTFNWGSRTHKSCLIFGGTVKYQKQDTYIDPKTGELARLVAYEVQPLFDGEPVNPKICGWDSEKNMYCLPDDNNGWDRFQDTFKGGKRKGEPKTKKVKVQGELKTKYQDFFFKFDGFVEGQTEWETKSMDAEGNLLYSTSSDTIEALEHSGVPFCQDLCRYEALNKEINTYFVSRRKNGDLSGMLTCVDKSDHFIHHNLNHCATVTARLSSDNPNLQNIPRADKSNLKRVFISRFGEDGSMVEADYSQLEVVVQGVLTGDKQLLEDLRNRIDFHCKRVALQPKYNITYDEVKAIIADESHPDHKKWKTIRTGAKIFSFQRAYGAGAPLIASFTGMTVDEVKELIAADEAAYPGVVDFNKEVEKTVQGNASLFYDPVESGSFRKGTYQASTGCLYSFRSYPAKDWQLDRGIEESFNPTEMKNYPIQGTGGEIVQGICGKLYRHFRQNDNYGGKAFLCNTVHDCVWVDCHKDVLEQVAKDIKEIMESVDEWFAQFGVEITVPFPVDVEAGPNMLDLKHI